MSYDKLIEDAIKEHNKTNPDLILRKKQVNTLSLYLIYCEKYNIWDSDECRLFLYLEEKLSETLISPFIALVNIDGKDRICIIVDVHSEL